MCIVCVLPQVLHSRCFLDAASGCHVAVPGIDMANHSSSAANAAVQLHQQHCPGAEEEIGAATDKAAATSGLGSSKSSSGNSSCFQLVAGGLALDWLMHCSGQLRVS